MQNAIKKYVFPVLAVLSVIQFFSCSNNGKKENDNATTAEQKSGDDADHKYTLQSAIITYKLQSASMPGDITSTLYFDHFGDEELTETKSNISMMGKTISTTSTTLIKDGYGYNWQQTGGTGIKYKIQNITDPTKIDYKHISADMMQQLGLTKSGKETVNGKECDVYTMNKENVGTGKYWIWNNILIKSETNMGGMPFSMEMTDLQENAIIDASVFGLPKDITFNEVSMPATH